MKYQLSVHLFIAVCLLVACQQKNAEPTSSNATEAPKPAAMPVKETSDTTAKINIAETDLASKKDLVCGMPAFRYLNDTAVFEKKIYGFCSTDCKAEFLKNPKQYIAAK